MDENRQEFSCSDERSPTSLLWSILGAGLSNDLDKVAVSEKLLNRPMINAARRGFSDSSPESNQETGIFQKNQTNC